MHECGFDLYQWYGTSREFNLRIKLSMIPSRSLTFDSGLVKNIQKAPNPSQKRLEMHLKVVLVFTDAQKVHIKSTIP